MVYVLGSSSNYSKHSYISFNIFNWNCECILVEIETEQIVIFCDYDVESFMHNGFISVYSLYCWCNCLSSAVEMVLFKLQNDWISN